MSINLKSIKKNTELLPPRIMLYGPHGLGKTTFGAGAPNPIFILTEDGLGQIEADHFPLATTFSQVQEALASLTGDHDFQTVVIDSLDWLDNLVWEEINTKYDAFGSQHVQRIENFTPVICRDHGTLAVCEILGIILCIYFFPD